MASVLGDDVYLSRCRAISGGTGGAACPWRDHNTSEVRSSVPMWPHNTSEVRSETSTVPRSANKYVQNKQKISFAAREVREERFHGANAHRARCCRVDFGLRSHMGCCMPLVAHVNSASSVGQPASSRIALATAATAATRRRARITR